MIKFKSSPLGLKQLLRIVNVVGILWTIGSTIYLVQINFLNDSQPIIKAIQSTKAILLETQTKSVINEKSYTLKLRNSQQGVEYSIIPSSSAPKWEKLGSDTSVTIQDSKIVFNPTGTVNSPTRKLSFFYEKEQKCLIFDSNLKNITQNEGSKCQ